jgi:hypothetical protein
VLVLLLVCVVGFGGDWIVYCRLDYYYGSFVSCIGLLDLFACLAWYYVHDGCRSCELICVEEFTVGLWVCACVVPDVFPECCLFLFASGLPCMPPFSYSTPCMYKYRDTRVISIYITN